MDKAMHDALAQYGETIQAYGWAAGEPLIAAGELRFKEFRNWTYALAIVLRTEELLSSVPGVNGCTPP